MSHAMRNIIVIFWIIVIATSIAATMHFYYFMPVNEAIIGAGILFCVLLVLYNNLVLQRHLGRVEAHFLNIHQFEQRIAAQIQNIKLRIHDKQAELDNDNIHPLKPAGKFGDGDSQLAKISEASSLLEEMASSRNEMAPGGEYDDTNSVPDNIIALKSRLKRVEKPAGGGHFRVKPSQLAKALNKGGAELYLQPILVLPSRNIRYFEAFIRLRIDDNILTAKQFLPAAKASGQIARVDLISLELTIKVVRGLQRQNNNYPVFWNVTAQSLGDNDVFCEILEYLRANQPLNRQLICEIPHSVFKKLNSVQSDNLARIRDLGYELSLDNLIPGLAGANLVETIFQSGLFSVVKVSAMELMRIGEHDITNFAEYIVPIAMDNNVTLIASEVENEGQTVSLIDADIFLAQGNGLMPAKALKKELGGS